MGRAVVGERALRVRLLGVIVALAAGVRLEAESVDTGGARFVEVGVERGLGPYSTSTGWGRGIAACDFDDDGDVDLFAPTERGVPDQLYRNLGDGYYEEVADELGLASVASHRAALWFDADGDRRMDLVVAGDCHRDLEDCADPDARRITLYLQTPDGTFQDRTDGSGLDDGFLDPELYEPALMRMHHRAGMAAGDLDGDGYLDLVICTWSGLPCISVFRNGGDGTFTDITFDGGKDNLSIFDEVCFEAPSPWQPILHDFDGDGALDIFIAVDFSVNRLLLNRGDGSFVRGEFAAGVADRTNEMGVALGDIDNDGDFDIYVTAVYRGCDIKRNRLYRNDSLPGRARFQDIACETGTENTGWGWGVVLGDVNGDEWVDIIATNGTLPGLPEDSSKLFLGVGGGEFVEASRETGFDDPLRGYGLVGLDHDRDGDLDLIQSCNEEGGIRLLENEFSSNNPGQSHLTVRLRMDGPNHRAIGAVVRAEANGVLQSRRIAAGTSMASQDPAEALFGLGTAETARVVVEWPDGETTVLEDVALDRVLTVRRESDTVLPSFIRGDCDGNGSVHGDVSDAVFLARFNFSGGEEPGCLAACDANGDGSVTGNVSDVIHLLSFNFLGGPPPAPPFPNCGPPTSVEEATPGCVAPPRCP